MASILVHISNEDPILGEVENLPDLTDQIVRIKNPRRRDGKDLHNLQVSVNEIIIPMIRITFIEIMPGDQDEDIIGFVRE